MSRKSQKHFSAPIKNKCFVSGTGTDSTNTQLSSWIWAPYGGQLFEKRTTIHTGCHRKQKSAYNNYATVQPDQGNENKRRGISANLRLTLWLKRQSFLHWVWGWGQKFGVLKFRHRLPASLQPTNVLVFLHKLLVELTLASSLQHFVYFTLEHRKRLIILEEIKTMWNADLPSQRKQTPKSEKG